MNVDQHSSHRPHMVESMSLAANPLISDWLAFPNAVTAVAHTGKVELGQGIRVALRQIVADELGLEITNVQLAETSVTTSPNEGFTAGSMSIEHSGNALRAACVAVRVLADSAHSGTTDYSHVDLNIDIAGVIADAPGSPLPVRYIGRSIGRDDFTGKTFGAPSFLQDVRLENQRYARVLRPPQRGCELLSLDSQAVEKLAGVIAVHRRNSFVGVVANSEWVAINSLEQLQDSAQWSAPTFGVDSSDISDLLRGSECVPDVLAEPDTAHHSPDYDPGTDPQSLTLARTYSRPYLAHASIGTSCAIAQFANNTLSIWTHSQGIFPLRADIARALELDLEHIIITHFPSAGCYGHNPADDVAYEAALLAVSLPGDPIALTWTREDELAWDPFGPAAVVDIKASISLDGKLEQWDYQSWSSGHSTRPTTLATPAFWAEELMGRQQLPPASDPPAPTGGGIGRNAIPMYDIALLRATTYRALDVPVRTSALRSLGAHVNVFATESHMDELAQACNMDPIEFRLHNLSDIRAREVLTRVAQMSDWTNRHPTETTALGVGVARYKNKGAWCATVAQLEVTDSVTVKNLWIAVDVGRVINPDGVLNQIHGGAIQSLSWTLTEQVHLSGGKVTTNNWEDYPITRFTDIPRVHIEILDRPQEQSLGSGETSIGPTAAALGNALARILGIRVVDMPLNSTNILRAIG